MTGQASSGPRPWSIVLASREVWPFVEGGGLGRYVWAAGRFLADRAEVTILTSSRWRDRYEELVRTGDERIPHGVRFGFVDEPEGDLAPYVSWNQAWGVRLLEGVARLHPAGGPDILELADYQAEGFAAVHARRGLDPRLRNTTLAIRLHTSGEICASLNEAPNDLHLRVLSGLERFSLRFADVLLEPGGNSLDRYADFYGEDSLAPALRSPLPTTTDLAAPAEAGGPRGSGPLRLLYLNRLERRKGIVELISAVRSLADEDLALTVVGGDTSSGPGGSSMRAHAEELAAGDPRISFADRVPHEEVPRLIAEHDAVVVPTRWETFSYVVRESLACNRPVIATPAGGILDVVRPGESGWLARSASAEDLAATLEEVAVERETLERMIAQGLPRAAFDRDTSDESTLAAYLELVERGRGGAAKARRDAAAPPRIAALVACEAAGGDPLPTLASLERQRDASVSSVLVVGLSGTFPGPGGPLALARAVVAGGAGAASWGTGLAQTSEDLVLLMPAGAVLEPDFASRAAAALAAEPALGWVSAYVRGGMKPSDAPLGTYALPVSELDVAPPVVLVRRAALEAALCEDDGELLDRLAAAGAHGLVLQEHLVAAVPRGAPQAVLAQR